MYWLEILHCSYHRQLYTDQNPLSNIAHGDFIELVFRLAVRPDRPEIDEFPKLTDPLWDLAEKCWLQDPKSRPTAEKLHDMIMDIITSAQSGAGTGKKEEEPQQDPELIQLKQTLLDQGRTLGEDHPDTLRTMSALVRTYIRLRQLPEAEDLALRAIEKQSRVLGDNDPTTAQTLAHLATTYNLQKNWKKAEELGVVAVARTQKVLGENNRTTVGTLINLAIAYRRQTNWKKAEELGVVAIDKANKVFGEKDADTLLITAHLADTYVSLGYFQKAEDLLIALLKKRKEVQGEEPAHPNPTSTVSADDGLGRDILRLDSA